MNALTWTILIGAAVLEVSGDILIRHGLRSRGIGLVVLGAVVLAAYGLLVNTIRWDFSKLLGVYVAFFASASVLFGWLVLREQIPISTWAGLALIVAGGLVIQFRWIG